MDNPNKVRAERIRRKCERGMQLMTHAAKDAMALSFDPWGLYGHDTAAYGLKAAAAIREFHKQLYLYTLPYPDQDKELEHLKK